MSLFMIWCHLKNLLLSDHCTIVLLLTNLVFITLYFLKLDIVDDVCLLCEILWC